MIFGSVCSGIEAASVAWEPIGWRAAWLAEIEPFPSAVLAHRWPKVPNHGDMTKLAAMVAAGGIPAPDILVGGTPCQAFSVAGRRESLDDERGQLTLSFTRLADEIDKSREADGLAECIIVWENVPGVLSTKDNAFGCFLGELAGSGCELQPAGKRWGNAGCVLGPQRAVAWRVLDAQYFGVAQRRRRVFVVASARNGFDPAAVLFEFNGVRRDTAPSREAGEAAARSVAVRTANTSSNGWGVSTEGQENAVITQYGSEVAGTLTARHDSSPCHDRGHNVVIQPTTKVRRLTPVECERLQGFPEVKISETIVVNNPEYSDALCSDHQWSCAPAESKSHRSQNNVLSADGRASASIARCVEQSSSTGQASQSVPVAVSVLIDLERMRLQIRSAGKSILSASIAGPQSESRLPIPPEDFALLAAHMTRTAAQTTTTGRAASLVSETSFSGHLSGSRRREVCGLEIEELANDAGRFISTVKSYLKSTMSQAGQNSPSYEQTSKTLFCYVAAAISGFIPVQIRSANSYALNVTISYGHTNVTYRNKPAADGPRYKAIGNSMAVPVMRWVGERIKQEIEK